jgi:signal transduction histidine kinase
MAETAQRIEAVLPRSRRLTAVSTAWEEPPGSVREARGRRVARDLVELSRLQSGAERPELTELDLAALLGTICVDYPGVVLDGPAQLALSTDSRRLARVLFTLLDNAFLHGAPPVTVSYNAAEVRVEDAGGGFAPRVLERVTQPFVTGDRSHGRGVGLGLAIAARHATLLGGELELTNSPAGGAIARLRLAAEVPALATA